MRHALRLAGLILALLALPLTAARAQDVAVSKGELPLEDLYRAIACGADAGGPCTTEIAKWPRQMRHPLRIYIHKPQAGFPEDKVKAVIASVRLAVTEINISGSDIRLEVVDDPAAPLHVHMLDVGWDDRIARSGDPLLDGARMRTTASAIRRKPGSGDIEKASIAVGDTIGFDIIRAAVLKSLMKALGLPYAIDNPYYTGKSVFAKFGHGVYEIRRQDMLALRLQYPTGCEKASDCLE